MPDIENDASEHDDDVSLVSVTDVTMGIVFGFVTLVALGVAAFVFLLFVWGVL